MQIPPFDPKTTKVVPNGPGMGEEIVRAWMNNLEELRSAPGAGLVIGGRLIRDALRGEPAKDTMKKRKEEEEAQKLDSSRKPEDKKAAQIAQPGGTVQIKGTY